ncbi:MAG TPA: chaperone modulator CbpM [Alphaproteobacteria bacterium]|nr:chaperone modulator CbpM [Alphaproteobacteria bacterium]
MKTLIEVLAEFDLSREELLLWIERRWVLPLAQGNDYVFGEADVARLQMIVELHRDLAIDDEAMSVVLDLLDKLYGLRRQMRDLLAAVDELPEAHREKLLSRIGRVQDQRDE